jgi:hypothetical protein
MEKLSDHCFRWTRSYSYCVLLLLDTTNFENCYPTTEELVCFVFGEDSISNSCATCILHTVSHGDMQLIIHLHVVQDIKTERVHFQNQESRSVYCLWCNCWLCSGKLPEQPTKINAPRWFYVKLYAQWMLHSCYCFCLQQMQNRLTLLLWGSHFQN